MSDEYIGKVIHSKYRIEELIGEGGMGKVYRARQLSLDKVVVLKVLRQSLLSDDRTVARFQREAKAASRLNHPNSISIIDFGQAEDGALFIAMEFVGGQDLHYLVSREWPMSERRIIGIVAQVLSALADAHRAGVIHRDLKPENIMVEHRRGEDFVKVLDFGIAKIIDLPSTEGPALTRAGFVCGTPEYMSPEQARGAPLDNRSDLYAVGVLLYQLVTGMLPFEADSAVGFASKHLNDEPVPPSKKRPNLSVSKGLEQLILKTLSKEPNKRPQSAEEFREALLALSVKDLIVSPLKKATATDEVSTSVAVDPLRERGRARGLRVTHQDRPQSSVVSARIKPRRWVKWVWAIGLMALMGVFAFVGIQVWFKFQGASKPPAMPLPLRAEVAPAAVVKALYEREPPAQRDDDSSLRLMKAGDSEWSQGRRLEAIERYEAAFRYSPRAELSLRLGEMYFQRQELSLAKGWWARHLKDAPESKAREYIEQRVGKL